MPLHIGEDIYDEIRGPYTMTVLTPRNEPDVTFLLLGEKHNYEDWEPCDAPRCANVQTDFIQSLDKLAKRYPVHLFLEAFFNDTDQMAGLSEKEKIYYLYQGREVEEIVPFSKKDKMMAWQLEQYDIRSPMVELTRIHQSCFYKNTRCPYPHIRWQYADARKQNVLTHSSVSSMMPVYYETIAILHKYRLGREMPEFPARLLHYETEWEDDYQGGITVQLLDHLGKQANRYLMNNVPLMKTVKQPIPHLFVEMLIILRDIITEPDDVFIEKLFEEKSVLRDQYRSLPPDLRAMFDVQSCMQIQRHYKATFPDREEEHEYVADLLTLLIDFYQTDRKAEIAAEIERMNYAEEQHSFISSVFMYYTSIVLDLYFIFRSYNRKKESKLVVGYFGNAHVDAQVHYLTNVVRTHTVSFHNEGVGRVHITPPVYLAYEEIGKRPKSGVSRKIAKRVSRKIVKRGTRRVSHV